jgi:hypothetical protein
MATPRFLAAVVAVIGALGLAATASAAPPHHGTGTSTLTSSTVLSARQAGGNTFVEQHNTRVDVGAFTGTVDEHLSLVVHANGNITFNADAVLHGTYAGCGSAPVTQSIHLTGRIATDGTLTANFATFGGAPVKVQGTVAGNAASDTATFEITYHC